jgi:hypothetical protein
MPFSEAATINASSCSYEDIQAAITNAQSGDTVLVPAGNCTWNNQLVITKGIYLIGSYEYVNASAPPPAAPGDLNGDVDIIDIGFVATHFGRTNAHPQWDATADVVANNEIDIYDVVFVASRFT